ncbi:hypothetical protein AVDCRST_MAG82-1047, partial [uncultured Rubrobacteraceae bacterium]
DARPRQDHLLDPPGRYRAGGDLRRLVRHHGRRLERQPQPPGAVGRQLRRARRPAADHQLPRADHPGPAAARRGSGEPADHKASRRALHPEWPDGRGGGGSGEGPRGRPRRPGHPALPGPGLRTGRAGSDRRGGAPDRLQAGRGCLCRRCGAPTGEAPVLPRSGPGLRAGRRQGPGDPVLERLPRTRARRRAGRRRQGAHRESARGRRDHRRRCGPQAEV